jgi:hypothetical protein
MRYLYLIALFPLASMATLNGRCTGSKATGEWGDHGICIRTSTCDDNGGVYKTGACPNDPDNVKCCIIGWAGSASTNPCGKYSYCDWTSSTCPGSWKTGKFEFGGALGSCT